MFLLNHYPGWLKRPSEPDPQALKATKLALLWSLLLLIFSISVSPSAYAQAANRNPAVRIAKVTPVDEGTVVNLDASASFPRGGEIVDWRWEQISGPLPVTINNANSAVASFVAPTIPRSHKRTRPIRLRFRLTATNDGTPSRSAARNVNVRIRPVIKEPIAVAGANRVVGLNESVTLDGSASNDLEDGGQIIRWRWRQVFTPGQPKKLTRVKLQQNLRDPLATFTAPSGALTEPLQFELMVIDNDRRRSTDTVFVTVSEQQLPQSLEASFSVSASTLEVGQQITAATTNISGGTQPYAITFDWGDGSAPTTGTQTSATHSYTQAGTYTLRTIVSDSGDAEDIVNDATITVTEVVSQPLAATFNVSSSAPTIGQQITASAANISGGTQPYTITFDWGDGSAPTTGSQTSAAHSYLQAGTYTLTTTVSDSGDAEDIIDTTTIVVSNVVVPISGHLSVAASQVAHNTPVVASITNIGGGTKPYTVTFDWGDGQSNAPIQLAQDVTGTEAEHFYELVGSYTIKVTITDADGQTREYTTSATVTDGEDELLQFCN